LVGATAFAVAAVACVARGRRALFAALGIVNALYAIEVLAATRFQLVLELRRLFTQFVAPYGERRPLQEALFLLGCGVAVVALILLARSVARGGGSAARTAVAITIAVAGLFGVELLSWHPVDRLLYHPLGPVFVIGWLWLLAGAGVALSTVRAGRGGRRRRASGQ
jgi:hypothetical protein